MRQVLVGLVKNGSKYDEVMNVISTGVCVVKELQGDFEIEGLYVDEPRTVEYDSMVNFLEKDMPIEDAVGVVFAVKGFWALTPDYAYFFEYMENEPVRQVDISMDVEYEGEDEDDEEDFE